MRKTILAPIVLLTVGAGILLHSCNSNSSNIGQPPPTEYAQPVVQPLKFGKPQKIDWDAIKVNVVKLSF